jgi:hypothetical protein
MLLRWRRPRPQPVPQSPEVDEVTFGCTPFRPSHRSQPLQELFASRDQTRTAQQNSSPTTI